MSHYVIQIDGRMKSHHRRFVDALRDALRLRDHFRNTTSKSGALQAAKKQLFTDAVAVMR
jgi:hypothetical protein